MREFIEKLHLKVLKSVEKRPPASKFKGRINKVPIVQREPPFTCEDVCRYFGVPFITETEIEFKPIKTKNEMKENENNSHYIVTTKSGRREKVNADQVRQSERMTRFYKGSDEVAIFNNDSVEYIVKGREIETR